MPPHQPLTGRPADAPAHTRVTTRAAPQRRASSLVVTPAAVAHRGASGYRPEHTLGAYRTAIRMGVDDIELDLVPTADGVLVARHESELSHTTDVAEHPELAHRRTRKTVAGRSYDGWFAEDLTLAEIKRLRARERMPDLRPNSAAHDGREGVPTLTEVLAMAQAESVRRGRGVGVMIEVKHAAYFASIGLDVTGPLVADLRRHGLDHARARVTLMSFETTVLRTLARQTRLPVVQLLGRPEDRPADLAAAGSAATYADLASPAGLAWVEEYADGIGVHKAVVLPPRPDGGLGTPGALVRHAHRRWLSVHVFTLRAENQYLPADLRSGDEPGVRGDLVAEATALLDAGVDGLICDHPDAALTALAAARRRDPARLSPG